MAHKGAVSGIQAVTQVKIDLADWRGFTHAACVAAFCRREQMPQEASFMWSEAAKADAVRPLLKTFAPAYALLIACFVAIPLRSWWGLLTCFPILGVIAFAGLWWAERLRDKALGAISPRRLRYCLLLDAYAKRQENFNARLLMLQRCAKSDPGGVSESVARDYREERDELSRQSRTLSHEEAMLALDAQISHRASMGRRFNDADQRYLQKYLDAGDVDISRTPERTRELFGEAPVDLFAKLLEEVRLEQEGA